MLREGAVKQARTQQWALKEMAKWLSHPREFGEKPVEQHIVYERDVSWPWEENPVRVFLVKYRMRKGFEGIGFTGPTTWSFVAIEDWKALTPEDLVCCYAGWYIKFFFINPKDSSKNKNTENAHQFINKLIKKRVVAPKVSRLSDVFKLGEDLIYYAIETIKDGEQVYLVGTEKDYTFYKKDLPQMQLPPLFYFLGKTFNPFREA
jgi:hypothetical protein